MVTFDRIFPSHVVAFTTGREVDFSKPPSGEEELLDSQRTFLQRWIGAADGFWGMRQVHEHRVVVWGKGNVPRRIDADAVVTRERPFALAVRTADCLPLFLYASDADAVGLVHAGWRGTSQGIAVETIQTMRREWKARPEHIYAVLGPAIRSCCYAVGPEFGKIFPRNVCQRDGKIFFDLPGENRRQLLEAGLSPGHIFDCAYCTCCGHDFFSYRREGEAAGRMISIVLLKGKA